MPTKIAPRVAKTVTIASGTNVATVDSTTDIWPGQIGWLSKSGQTDQRVRVTEVPSSTTCKLTREPLTTDANFRNAMGSTAGNAYPGNLAGGDLNAYSSGTLTIESQLVPTQPDYTKLPGPR